MAKESHAKQFRKGTKSCVECRQRKLRCIPAADDSQPCQNCEAKGRHCVLQVHAGRNSNLSNSTSRDRIRQLEDSVGKLWTIVKDLRTELGHTNVEASHDHAMQSDRPESDAASESEGSEMSPMTRPTHLQQLFDNEILDTQSGIINSPENSTDKAPKAVGLRARTRLQALVPPKADLLELAPLTVTWFSFYHMLFPAFSTFHKIDEINTRYDELLSADADPVVIAGLLLWTAIAVRHATPEILHGRSELVKSGLRFARKISDAVEETVVMDDALAGSLAGVEVCLLWIRLQLSTTNTKKMWLVLRRCVALAELIGISRARSDDTAAVWESICILDRLIGMMFNTPLGTTAHGLPPRQEVTFPNGDVNIKAYLTNLARISTAVQEIDDAYLWGKPDRELFDKVSKTDQDLRALRAMTPDSWWLKGMDLAMPEVLMQFWHNYLTARAHLQLALRNSADAECTYSFLTCTKACRDLADCYIRLRSTLPAAFFAGRVIDLEAMTAAIILIYTSHRSGMRRPGNVLEDNSELSRQEAFRIVQMMDFICQQVTDHVGSDVARKAAKAVRLLDRLLSQSAPMDSQTLSLRIPLLGRLDVRRHSGPVEHSGKLQQEQNRAPSKPLHNGGSQLQPDPSGIQSQNFDAPGMEPIDPWTMDLLIDDSLSHTVGDDFLAHDQWFSFADGWPAGIGSV